MSTYSIEKLTRSLSLKVQERLNILLPEAIVTPIDDYLTVKYGELEGNISLDAMVEACHSEGRDLWGPIAGGFCNLVVSRLISSLVPPLDSSADLDEIWISMI
ncbi:MAG TPA: hypothetical protein EYO58_03710, partial [Flavobacteriales bacterium]|nr:hypothetical protein [Flavobacteriales bacterium]